jgi:glycosyltransferase involved in cell wall biosynthesis
VHITHCIDNLGVGGSQSMLFELFHAIKKHYPNCGQTVISSDRMPPDKSFINSYGVPFSSIRNEKGIIKKIASKSDVAVIYHKLASSDTSLVKNIKKKVGCPVVVINHTFFNSRRWSRFSNCDVMVGVSVHMKNHLKKWHPRIKKFKHIYNGVDSSRYDGVKAQSRDRKKTLYTGRINRVCVWKHSDSWVNWAANVSLPYKMVHEYIGGPPGNRRGRNTRPLSKKARKGRNKVDMMGNISNFKQKVSILKSWDLALYETIRSEGISMFILESLACGVPVICSNHYGNKEIIEDGVNGYVFKDKNHATRILTKLCNDKEKLKRLKKSTKKHFLENLDAKHTARKYIELIEKIKDNSKIKIQSKKEKKKEVKVVKEEKKAEVIEKNNKFTIISSAYNKEKYLDDWVNSILVQKYRPLEVVVSDDCSSDNTSNMLDSYKSRFKDSGIEYKFIQNRKRLYCGSAYKNLVQYMTGSYYGVLDADDMLTEDAVEYIMGLYNKHKDIAWIYTQFLWCDENMKKKRTGFNSAPGKNDSLLSMGDRRMHGVGCGWRTFNYKIERKDKIFPDGLTCAVDKYMAYRLEEMGNGLFVDRICYKHRGHPIGSKNSVSSTKYAIKMWEEVRKKAHWRRKKYNKKVYKIKRCSE